MPRESGFYPPGAEHDKNAPWNEPDEEGYDYSDDYCDECGKSNDECVGEHEPVHDEDRDEYDPWEDFTGHEDDLDKRTDDDD